MEEEKVCSKCKELLPIDRFGTTKRNNKVYMRNVCKSCNNKQRKLKKEKGENELAGIFNELEIKTLKSLIETYPMIKNLKENKIVLEKSLNKKSIRTINLEDNIYKILKNKSDETNLSISDIVNTMLRKAIEYL